MSKLSLRIFINTSHSAVFDPQILKLISTEHLVQMYHWMSQSTPERINQTKINSDRISQNSSTKSFDI